jgi:hypothetical protein
MVLGDVVVWRLFYLAAKPSSVGVDVDGLSYPLHRPTTNGCQTIAVKLLVRCCSLLLGCQAPLEGVTAPAGPHTIAVKLGTKAPG